MQDRYRRRLPVVASVMAALMVFATGCSSDGSSVALPPTPAASISTPVPPTTVPNDGCAHGPTTIPVGAASETVPDIDGDGQADIVWITAANSGTTTVGVVTAAGGGAEREFQSASPVKRAILVVDADRSPPVEILADDGRSVQLWVFDDCQIADVLNVQGEPYLFSLGFADIGTGVGCVTTNSHQQLVGLDVTQVDDTTVDWSRTVVDLNRRSAQNGASTSGTFTRPQDDRNIDLLYEVTCGGLTMTEDGLSAPEL